MSAPTILNVDPRTRIGHANVKLAPQGIVPAVVYGPKIDAMPISVSLREFEAALAAHGPNQLVNLAIAGTKKPVQALIRAVQRNPITRIPEHIDFLAVDAKTMVTSSVSIHAVGEPEGVRLESGMLNIELHELAIEALPSALPERIDYDVSALNIGDVLTVADLTIPEGVTVLTDSELVICSVMPPQVEAEVEVSTEETQPEVIGEVAE